MGFFVCVLCFSTLSNSYNIEEAALRALSFFLLYFITFIFPLFSLREHDDSKIFFGILCVCGFYIFGSLIFIAADYSFSGGRMRGITNNANTLGSLAAIFITGYYGYIKCAKHAHGIVTKLITYGLLLLSIVIVYLTQSRSAMAATVTGVLCIQFYFRNYRNMVIFVFTILLVYFFLNVINDIFSVELLSDLYAEREYGGEGRTTIWQEQLDRFYTSPLIGVGMEIRTDISTARRGGESSFTELLATTGLLGFIPFMSSIIMVFKYNIININGFFSKAIRDSHPNLRAPLLGMMVTVITNSIGEGFIAAVGSLPSIVFWFLLSYLSLDKRQKLNRVFSSSIVQ